MKQHVTVEQVNQLSEKGKNSLREWWKPIEGDFFMRINPVDASIQVETTYSSWNDRYEDNNPDNLSFPLLSIGQMIEFLDHHAVKNWQIALHKPLYDINYPDSKVSPDFEDFDNLCDALWDVVKEILEEK